MLQLRIGRLCLDPLTLVGLLTWLVVSYEVWLSSARLGPLGPLPAQHAAALLLLVYLVGFLGPAGLPWFALMAGSALGVLLLGPTGTAPVLLIIVAVAAVEMLPQRAAITAVALINVAVLAVFAFVWEAARPLLLTLIYGAFQAFAVVASLAMRRAEESAARLREVNAHLLATRSLLAESARESERLRLSRELHDVSGHKLTALKLNLAVLAQDAALAGRRELEVARTLVDELLHDIRQVVSQLRRHEGIDLRQALQELAAPLPAPRVHVQVDDDARIDDAERAAALVRLAQEGLTNAARHAASQNVWLRLTRDRDRLRLVVEDDGRIAGPVRPGHGLTGMRERVAELGGELEIGTAERGGLRLCASLPRERTA